MHPRVRAHVGVDGVAVIFVMKLTLQLELKSRTLLFAFYLAVIWMKKNHEYNCTFLIYWLNSRSLLRKDFKNRIKTKFKFYGELYRRVSGKKKHNLSMISSTKG